MIVCAGDMESFDFAKPIGIGLVQSAINLTKILADLSDKDDKNRCASQNSLHNEDLIFIGSCGLYGNGNLLEIYESKTAENVEISSMLGLSYSPIYPKFSRLAQDNFFNVSCETFICNSSNFITTDSKIAKKFSELGLFMENMEGYSVLEVAKKFDIKARLILCSTNFCDKNAHKDFIKNYPKAKQILENYLKKKGIL